jgi:hypothetical protein
MIIPAKPYLYAGALVAVLALVIMLQAAWGERDRARAERDAARNATVVATAQGDLNQSAAEAVQAAQTREVSITVQAERYADAVAAAPGGDAPVPSGVLDSWRAGVESFREPTP